ncbi:MAG: hypothetical protein IPG63_08470 [Xanthomonadales bacterium]|nr:hypothetical protein [Xanthomonadales bacterium]
MTEFVAVMPELDGQNQSLPLLDRLVEVVSRPVEIGELQLLVSASIVTSTRRRIRR